MLVLFSTALGANVSPLFLRSSVREALQSAAASVLSMLSPVVPQEDGPGASSELNVADPAVSVQANPEFPPLQVHPGDVTVVTEQANSREDSAVENTNVCLLYTSPSPRD